GGARRSLAARPAPPFPATAGTRGAGTAGDVETAIPWRSCLPRGRAARAARLAPHAQVAPAAHRGGRAGAPGRAGRARAAGPHRPTGRPHPGRPRKPMTLSDTPSAPAADTPPTPLPLDAAGETAHRILDEVCR